jgi:hypothetical protein
MRLKEIQSSSSDKNWKQYLQSLPVYQKDIYYIPKFYQLYEDLNDGVAKCFVFQKDSNIALYPFLLNSINSLGYHLDQKYYDIQGCYGYNGMVSSTNSEDFLDAFYHSFFHFCKKNNVVAEFTRFHPLLDNHKFSNKHMQVIYDRETVALDLTKDYESIWLNEYSSKNRNMIRKARKTGYKSEIIESPTASQINTFIDIYTYSMKMAEADKYFFFNKYFFHNTFLYLKEFSLLFNVLDERGDVVCSSIFFHYGDFFHYHLSGRTDKASNAVNNFLLDEAVKFAQKKGAKKFHFGGGRSPNQDDSLLKFKSSFSKTSLPFYIGKKIHNKTIYDEIVRQWEEKSPEKNLILKNHLLRYRY